MKWIKEYIWWIIGIGIGIFILTGKNKSLVIDVAAVPSMYSLMNKYYPEGVIPDGVDSIYFTSKQLVYKIYYTWDDKIDSKPYWSIGKLDDNNWYVTEWANGRNKRATPRMKEDLKYYSDWYNDDNSSYIERTRSQMIRHMLFGVTNQEKEKNAFNKVNALLKIENEFRENNLDVHNAMEKYLTEHPVAMFIKLDDHFFDSVVEEHKKENTN